MNTWPSTKLSDIKAPLDYNSPFIYYNNTNLHRAMYMENPTFAPGDMSYKKESGEIIENGIQKDIGLIYKRIK